MLADIDTRAIKLSDYPDWHRLWVLNNAGHVSHDITEATWKRLHEPGSDFRALGAFSGGHMVGFLHAVIHPVTGAIQPVCYMQDVFVDPPFRRQGVARALILALAELGKAEHWHRIYWLAEGRNEAAQRLYQSLGVRLDFTLHAWPLGAQ